MPENENKRYISNSLVRGLEVIKMFSAKKPTLSLAEIANGLGVSRTVPYRLLYTLEELGYLYQDNSTKRYSLTPKVLELGFSYLNGLQLPELSSPYLEKLRDLTGISAHMGVLDGKEIVYVSRFPSSRVSSVTINVGSRLPVYATSMGKCLLAYLPEEQMERLLSESDLKPITQSTKTEKIDLRKEISVIRDQGYALSKGEFEEGIWSVACPVFGESREVIAAINVAAPQHVVNDELIEQTIIPATRKTSDQISSFMMYSK
ncbi:IclR family transcriptional regulator [Alteribacillus bidgolensis]|uniref:Transcriptional regulator, IclR family n=1 Tax=Alteribacillus bidgolensis TaxID=930129 RepID=A0A1G8FPJ1_9BACI|nr:IclR family transcriptional regulator [Alteribacillus bidgolensis]SDH84050.1 transcriptional regulator, IclR family [Alteribacillus bidgolensis]